MTINQKRLIGISLESRQTVIMVFHSMITFSSHWIRYYKNLPKENKMKLSARNVLKGKIVKIIKGAVNSEVLLELEGGVQVVSVITNTSVDHLELSEGNSAYAVIKASNVMLAVD
jgi:molybdopterin-binding protein